MPNDDSTHSDRDGLEAPYKPKRASNVRSRMDNRLRRRLPAPAYEALLHGYHGIRKAAGRNPGRGHLLPDFAIIGAAKAGTTSVFAWLVDHPLVEGPRHKELNYFSHYYYRGEDWYRQHFPTATSRAAFATEHGRAFLTGEASPSYLLHDWAPERMRALVPAAKLIVQLRNPVDRAYSQFQMRRRDHEEPLESFDAAVDREAERLDKEHARMLADRRYSSYEVACWSYLMRSRYAEQLERWFEHFPRAQFHFIALEDLARAPERCLANLLEFLELPARASDDFRPRFGFEYDPLSPETRSRLEAYFKPHNERLYELVGVDFGW